MNTNANLRTSDVLGDAITFDGLLLPTRMIENLTEAGYHRPSPVQHAAIPLARLGTDLVIQAKAGTGKTLVFAIASVERVDVSNKLPQVLILAPTREVALQASDSILDVAGSKSAISTVTLIGGLPTAEDERVLRRKCHIVVGTPGRTRFLIQRGNLLTEHIALLVLDEADKLLAKGQSMRSDVESILAKIPSPRQTIAVSATFSEDSMKILYRIMKKPYEVRLSKDSSALIGVPHYYFLVDSGAVASDQSDGREDPRLLSFTTRSLSGRTGVSDNACKSSEEESSDLLPKLKALSMLLTCASFHQAVVFCNGKRTASMVSERLRDMGISVSDMSSSKNQLERIRVMNDLRDFVLRVVVATDLAARGVDLEGVDMVVNFDVPEEPATLAHRLGRAGRFGTYGCAVSLVYSGHDGGDGSTGLKALVDLVAEAKGSEPLPLPRPLPPGWKPRQCDDTEKVKVMIQSGTIRSSNRSSVWDGKRTPASVETSADSGTERSGVRRDVPGCFDARRAAAEADVERDVCEESEENGQDGDLMPFEEVRNATLWPEDIGDLPRASAWPLPICALERNLFVDTYRPSEVEASPLVDRSEGGDLSGHQIVHVASGDGAVADAVSDGAGEEDIEIPYSVIPKDKDMEIQAAELENEDHHYNQVVESVRLDLHGEHKKSMQGLKSAFETEETRRNVPSLFFPTQRAEISAPLVHSERNQTQYVGNTFVVGRHRRPLGTTQSAAYAQHVQKNDLAAEAKVLEKLMLEDAEFENEQSFEPLNRSDEHLQDTEDAWRQYWLQHYEAYGYYPGGQPPPMPTLEALRDRLTAWDNRPEEHGYVSVPAHLLVRYLELEKWYRDENEKAPLPSGMMDTTTRMKGSEGDSRY